MSEQVVIEHREGTTLELNSTTSKTLRQLWYDTTTSTIGYFTNSGAVKYMATLDSGGNLETTINDFKINNNLEIKNIIGKNLDSGDSWISLNETTRSFVISSDTASITDKYISLESNKLFIGNLADSEGIFLDNSGLSYTSKWINTEGRIGSMGSEIKNIPSFTGIGGGFILPVDPDTSTFGESLQVSSINNKISIDNLYQVGSAGFRVNEFRTDQMRQLYIATSETGLQTIVDIRNFADHTSSGVAMKLVDGSAGPYQSTGIFKVFSDIDLSGKRVEIGSDSSAPLNFLIASSTKMVLDVGGNLVLDNNMAIGTTINTAVGLKIEKNKNEDSILSQFRNTDSGTSASSIVSIITSDSNLTLRNYPSNHATNPDSTEIGSTATGTSVSLITEDTKRLIISNTGYVSLTSGASINEFSTTVKDNDTSVPTGSAVLSELEGSYAEIYTINNATATTLTTQNTWYQVTIFTANGISQNLTPDYTNDHITVTKDSAYKIIADISFTGDVNNTYQFQFKKNNGATDITSSMMERELGSTASVGAGAVTGGCECSNNDTIELWARCITGASKSVTVKHTNVFVSDVK